MLFVPAVNSFIKKIEINRFYEIGAKRIFNYSLGKTQPKEFIVYINRIKNLNKINLSLKDRIDWKKQNKTKNIELEMDESWKNKCLPIKNNLDNCCDFLEGLSDIDSDSLIGKPIKILRL